MKPATFNLPAELTDKIGQIACDSERSRSYVVRKLLESALTGEERLEALKQIAAQGLEDANAPRERAPNATAVIANSCSDGRNRLDALQRIANGGKDP
ncbi:MAG: ribbon-helix-helix protein, CopG family [Steroidobacteraceae bacterium]